jgi:hypothetical protein|tara:strand:+ start:1969 stop:2142 length:174 start_codon:yes stop_codon:yes gene_type:complete
LRRQSSDGIGRGLDKYFIFFQQIPTVAAHLGLIGRRGSVIPELDAVALLADAKDGIA